MSYVVSLMSKAKPWRISRRKYPPVGSTSAPLRLTLLNNEHPFLLAY